MHQFRGLTPRQYIFGALLNLQSLDRKWRVGQRGYAAGSGKAIHIMGQEIHLSYSESMLEVLK